MQTETKRPATVSFPCPVCTAPNEINLIVLVRKGGMTCVSCNRHLRSADVSRAIHNPRTSM